MNNTKNQNIKNRNTERNYVWQKNIMQIEIGIN